MNNIIKRFEDKVMPEPNTGCWIWTGSTDPDGYGRITVNNINNKASRVSYELYNGPLNGFHVLHICDNRICVNPSHLKLGTHQENMIDMSLKGRSTHGIKSAHAKFTEIDIKIIREARGAGYRIVDIAKYYKRHKVLISQILRRKVWARV